MWEQTQAHERDEAAAHSLEGARGQIWFHSVELLPHLKQSSRQNQGYFLWNICEHVECKNWGNGLLRGVHLFLFKLTYLVTSLGNLPKLELMTAGGKVAFPLPKDKYLRFIFDVLYKLYPNSLTLIRCQPLLSILTLPQGCPFDFVLKYTCSQNWKTKSIH